MGTEVTITGLGFGSTPAANTVKFGGVTVPTTDISYASRVMIKAKVPQGARTGLISVTVSGDTGRSKNNFIVEGVGAKWTFMVYLDADNNLESAGIDDFLEMASVGSSNAVNIVVQMDRIPGYATGHGNWTGTKRFLIQRGDNPSVTPLQDLGEQNMGDPAVLRDFVEWAVTTYPAERYALAIWNHGGGWRFPIERSIEMASAARSRGETPPSTARAVAWDDTDNDKLFMKEVQNALEAAKDRLQQRLNTAVKLDVVGFDACLMGMVEVAYALRNVANYVVGSEETEPADGWPYNTILADLSATPTLSPAALAGTIVTRYGQAYSSGVTQSAVDVGKLGSLAGKIDVFTEKAITEWNSLGTARTNAREYHDGCGSVPTCWGVDLWDFADRASTQVTSPEIKAAAGELKNAIDDFVIQEHHSSNMAGSHGVAIYFPPSHTVFNNDPEHTGYEESNTFMPVDFVTHHRWDNWLTSFNSNVP